MNISHNAQLLPNTEEWTDEQWTTFRNWIVSHLQAGPVTVTFNKKDGAERVMTCSLQPELLPPATVKESTTAKKENNSIISVYDLTAQGWRSFIVKNVTNVTLKL
jgi:hypothetical protein